MVVVVVVLVDLDWIRATLTPYSEGTKAIVQRPHMASLPLMLTTKNPLGSMSFVIYLLHSGNVKAMVQCPLSASMDLACLLHAKNLLHSKDHWLF